MATRNSMTILPHILGIFTGFIGALIVLLVSDDQEVKAHSKKVLNWQLSLIIYYIISTILVIIIIGILFIPILMLLNLIFSIMGAVKANDGKLWDYPLSIKFLK